MVTLFVISISIPLAVLLLLYWKTYKFVEQTGETYKAIIYFISGSILLTLFTAAAFWTGTIIISVIVSDEGLGESLNGILYALDFTSPVSVKPTMITLLIGNIIAIFFIFGMRWLVSTRRAAAGSFFDRSLICIIGILFFAAVSAGIAMNFIPEDESSVQQLSATPEDLPPYWKTYRNESYGFEIKYVPTVFPKETSQLGDNPVQIMFLYPDPPTAYFSITVIDTIKPRTLSNFFDNPDTYRLSSDNKELDPRLRKIIIDSTEWNSYYYVGGVGEAEPLSFISRQGNLVVVITVNSDSYLEIFEILSAFKRIFGQKFTGWQVYLSDNEGFELQIPAGMIAIDLGASPSLADFILVNRSELENLEKDPLFATNPLLAALDRDIDGLRLTRTLNPLSESDDNVRSFISRPLAIAGREVQVTVTSFAKRKSDNGQFIYLYSVEAETVQPVKINGALWINNGAWYELSWLKTGLSQSEETLWSIASSFRSFK